MKKLLSATLAALTVLSSASAFAASAAGSNNFVQADADGDGTVSIQDATKIQKFIAHMTDIKGKDLLASDVDGDGDVMVTDATCVQKLLVGMVNKNNLKSAESNAKIKEKGNKAMNDFAANLLKTSVQSGENTLVSPLSVMYALSMAANGANNATLKEMENVLGMTNYEMNRYFYDYSTSVKPGSSSYYDDWGELQTGDVLNIANSIWYNNSNRMPSVSKSFLQSTKDFYNAEIYPLEFNGAAVGRINSWVNEKTDQMIPQIIDNIDPDSLMCLINAISFDAKWRTPYDEYHVEKETFTNEDGTKTETDFLWSWEDYYIQDGNKAEGFVKKYRSGNYAFAALLPNAGTSIESYVNSLTGSRISNALDSMTTRYEVFAELPKFKVNYSDELNDNLNTMGMNNPFTDAADFGRMLSSQSTFPIKIDNVIHKTVIDVNEAGTKAAAVTAIGMIAGSAEDYVEPERKYIVLNRPFVYMLIDLDKNTPMFIGTMEDLSTALND